MAGEQKRNSASTQEPKAKCALCSAEANSHCGGCNKVSYCTKEHQKKHWKIHKSECCCWKICESPLLGRYLAAVRDIKAGEILLKERPILVTPPKVTPPICLGCYREFHLEQDDQLLSMQIINF